VQDRTSLFVDRSLSQRPQACLASYWLRFVAKATLI